MQDYLLSESFNSLLPILQGGKYRLQKYVVQIAQHWFKVGSSLWAMSLPQVWQPMWSWVAEHWNPSLAATHSLHLSLSSSSEAERSDDARTNCLPLPRRAGGAFSTFFFSITLPWIRYLTLKASNVNIFLALRSYYSLGSRF